MKLSKLKQLAEATNDIELLETIQKITLKYNEMRDAPFEATAVRVGKGKYGIQFTKSVRYTVVFEMGNNRGEDGDDYDEDEDDEFYLVVRGKPYNEMFDKEHMNDTDAMVEKLAVLHQDLIDGGDELAIDSQLFPPL